MRTVKAQFRAGYTDYDGLDTYRAMPSRNVPIETLEPFIFLNHHGPQVYPAQNKGLPFGPHPHKGFETVTIILEGDVMHTDSSGHSSIITAGGVQWMTAGKGIIHSEISSENFKRNGGGIELLQLWVNLPASLKNADPGYTGLQKEEVPELVTDDGRVTMHLVSGTWNNVPAPIQSLSAVQLTCIDFRQNGQLTLEVPPEKAVLFYVIKGSLNVNGEVADRHELVQFNNDGSSIAIRALENSTILFGHATPTHEPIVAQGPFVMNTQNEIRQAFVDYQEGRFEK